MSEVTPLTIASHSQANSRLHRLRQPLGDLSLWAAAVLLTVYLGLSGGGYDVIVRSELGLIIWWLLLLGTLIGALPRIRLGRSNWVAAGLLAGFLLWSWIGLAWTSSHEQTLDAVSQISTYLGTFLIGCCLVTRRSAPILLSGLACGIAVVSGAAILSKLAPSLFPANPTLHFYATARLSYPFDYADGVGEFAALGIPVLLYAASCARTTLGRALAGAGLPLVLLCLAMTVSRGGMLAAAIGLLAFFMLVGDRIPKLGTLLIAAVGIAILMVALLHRAALRDEILPAPAAERHSMLTLVIVVVLLSAFAHGGLDLLRRRFPRQPVRVSRAAARGLGAGALCFVALVVVVAITSGTVSHMWHDFKEVNPSSHSNQYFRLLSLAGSHRYQYWQVALKAFRSAPLIGIGPGTFRFYWAIHQTLGEYVLNAHSLWFETLAETGLVGLLLIAGFFGYVLIGGARRALRELDLHTRATLAAAVAGVAAFCGAAAFDWVWQIGVVPMTAMLMAAVAASGLRGSEQPAARMPQASSPGRSRWLIALGSVPAMILIAIPLAMTVAVRDSQSAARRGRLTQALNDANLAARVQPGAATPRLQQALVLEQMDDIPQARQAIAAATAREPDNSSLWLVASRLAVEADRPLQALGDYEHAKRLDPTSTLFEG